MYDFEKEVNKVKEYKRILYENVDIVETWVNKELTYKELAEKYNRTVTNIFNVLKYYSGDQLPVKIRHREILDTETGLIYNNITDVCNKLRLNKELVHRNISGGSKRFIYTK